MQDMTSKPSEPTFDIFDKAENTTEKLYIKY